MSAARRYFESRAISAQVAYDAGVRPGRNANELAFPNGRRRVLDAGKVLQTKGKPLAGWWIAPPEQASWTVALVCEGESDSLAARSVLPDMPGATGLCHLPILCIPGTGYPIERLTDELSGRVKEALIATDPDEAGEKFAAEAAEALLDVKIRPVRVQVPEPDLAGWLATVEEAERGERLASLLIDSELAAPSRAELYRRREVAALRARADELEAGPTDTAESVQSDAVRA